MSGTDSVKDLREMLGALSERGVLSGVYCGVVQFLLVLGATYPSPITHVGWIFAALQVNGLIVSSIAYEFLLPGLGVVTQPFVVKGFRSVSPSKWTYADIRRSREALLAREENRHFQEQVLKDIKFRQSSSYFLAASMVNLLTLFIANRWLDLHDTWFRGTLMMVVYVLFGSLVGVVSRSFILGRTIAFAVDHKSISSTV